MDRSQTLSPLDGRYYEKIAELVPYFSDFALTKYRLRVEIEYFIALSLEPKIKELRSIPKKDQISLRKLYKDFSQKDYQQIKKIEAVTAHDVKAVEYFLKKKLSAQLKSAQEFVHFALTSEDINNIAYALMWSEALSEVYIPSFKKLTLVIEVLAKQYQRQPLLSLTHGQSATPTTLGKELKVFTSRLRRQINQLSAHRLQAKCSGATGTWSAHMIAYPEVDWLSFTKRFITSFNLEPNILTTQIEPHDSLIESTDCIRRAHTILLDFTRDMWLYISRGVIGQKRSAKEVGSSTMPHKINPIHFENAEGNLGLANAVLHHLSDKLPVSRLQRDLSDSTVLRNLGVPLGYGLLAIKSLEQGLNRIQVNVVELNKELDEYWEILAEAIQIVLRKHGDIQAYEKLKELTRGEKITKAQLREFISKLKISQKDKDRLLNLTPQTYIGLSGKI